MYTYIKLIFFHYFRSMNIDYELVGFYQAHLYGACFTHDMLDSLVDYQSYIQDGVVLIYGKYY